MKKSHRALWHALTGASALALPLSATAIPFELGPVQGSVNTTISAGVSLRTQGPSSSLIGIANGGTARSVNEDDGNYGFASGDLTSATAKVSHDIEFKHKNYGVFSRVSYFYDNTSSEADKFENRRGANGQVAVARNRGSYELGPIGRDRLGSEFKLLDLFAYGNFDLAGHGLSVRFGKQVVSWGESTFIGNGINAINPIDVARIRAPGAELKEAFVPTPMLHTSFQVSNNLSLEGLWMTAYDKTRIDPRGSFFSTNDFVSDDGDRAVVSFGRREDENQAVRVPAGANAGSASVWVPRDASQDPRKTRSQYGFAARYFAEQLNNSEFGLFYLKYHSRTPLVSAVRGGSTNVTSTAPTCSSSATTAGCRATFFSEFPENIELYGMSFNTTAPFGVAVQGEYSFRPNQPVQISGAEVLLTALGVPSSISPAPLAAGTVVQGYTNTAMHQAQVTLTKAYGPTFGANQFVMLGEVGVTHLDLDSSQRYAGGGTSLPSCGFASAGTLAAVSNGSCQEQVGGGYASKDSWGYRLVNRLDFENVIGAIQVSPRLVWSHDVNGVGPNFSKGNKAITLGAGFNYLQRWQADIGYTTFFGGRTFSGTDAVPPGVDINPDPNVTTLSPGDSSQSQSFATGSNGNKDRDFLAISVSYAF